MAVENIWLSNPMASDLKISKLPASGCSAFCAAESSQLAVVTNIKSLLSPPKVIQVGWLTGISKTLSAPFTA
ncbi:hypothetical protein [Paraglaciecola sp.]|uniref:hypothetical protein n=1 Tax=Paraglaciecola sp. TaxID=1920173 RepID=UPI00273D5872|nr:hypothetical protein [Paraglaciecola sp.]MDP5029702.1 hypothetical protein [Paraglaciecola sp.]